MKGFATTAVLWLAGIGLISGWINPSGPERTRAVFWTLGLGILTLVDFLAIAGLMRTVFRIMVPPEKTHPDQSQVAFPLGMQAIIWGALKLNCLALFALLLYRGGRSIPTIGIILGTSTIVAVPLIWGLWEFRRGRFHE